MSARPRARRALALALAAARRCSGARRRAGRRLARDGRRARRRTLLAAHRHHARERDAAARRLDVSPRRLLGGQLPAAGEPRQRLRVHADRRRRSPVLHDAAQSRDRARSRDGPRALELRSEARARPSLREHVDQPRRRVLARRARGRRAPCARARLPGDARRAPDRARRRDRAALRRLRRRAARSICAPGIAPLYDDWEYNVTSPPTVVGDVVSSARRSPTTCAPTRRRGDVRAFDARSGAAALDLRHRSRAPASPAHETWETGTRARPAPPTSGRTITADLARDLVFLPVSTPSPDYYGGDRPGDNLYADSVVALDARTGERRWHFQTVHHDLWDYDLAAPPMLRDARARRQARSTRSCRRPSTGFVFVLDRETGEPLFPIEERPVPPSDVPGERASPTQPVPARAAAARPAAPRRGRSLRADARAPRGLPRAARRAAQRRPLHAAEPARLDRLSRSPRGGANWSGATWDPARQLLVVPVQNLAHVIRLDEVAERASGGGADVKPLHGVSLRTLWWLLTGRGTGERYRLSPISGRTLFEHDGVPCNRAAVGEAGRRRSRARDDRLARVDQHRRRRPGGQLASAPRSRPRAASSSTRGTQAPGAARARRRDRRAHRHASRCRPACTPDRSPTGCGPTASSSWWSRRAATSASARRSATT